MNPAAPVTNAFMIRSCALRARSGNDGPGGAEEDLEIEPQRPLVDVFEVHLHPVIKVGDLVPAAHLPQACDSGTDAQLSLLPETIAVQLVRKRGTRADERHVAFENA